MKLYKKSDLEFRHGMLIANDGNVVAVDNEIIDLANELETEYQKACYLEEQPEPVPERSLDNFEREHYVGNPRLHVNINTPLLDAKIEEAMSIMTELDAASANNNINDLFEQFSPLVDFVASDEVLSIDGQVSQHKFDTPKIGNPLEITNQKLVFIAAKISYVRNGLFDELEVRFSEDKMLKDPLKRLLENSSVKDVSKEFDPSDGVDPYEQEQTEGDKSGD